MISTSNQITVTVKANSKHREEVVKNNSGELMVYVKDPATEGRANEKVVRLLARHFEVTKSQVTIVRGLTSRRKTIRIKT